MFKALTFLLALLFSSPALAQAYTAAAPALGDLGTYAVADLPACNGSIAKRTAWASNLFGSPLGDRVVCDGTYWKPIRPLAVTVDVTSANLVLTPLMSAPTQVLQGTLGLGVTRNVTLSTTYAYPGAKFCATRAAGGLGALSVQGLVSGLTTALGINAWACWEFTTGNVWIQTQSGGLL